MNDPQTDPRLADLESRLARLEEENRLLRRVKDAQDIQNVFSLHEYYHQANRHGDEMDAIWAQETEGLAMEEAVLNGRYVGLEAVGAYYVDFFAGFYKDDAGRDAAHLSSGGDGSRCHHAFRRATPAHSHHSRDRGGRRSGDGKGGLDIAPAS